MYATCTKAQGRYVDVLLVVILAVEQTLLLKFSNVTVWHIAPCVGDDVRHPHLHDLGSGNLVAVSSIGRVIGSRSLIGIQLNHPLRSVLVYDIRNDVRSVACAREILFVNDTPVSKKSSMSWAGACHLDVVGSPCLPFASHFARSYSSGAIYP